ncbi:MAG: hypothetical protein NVSMB38_13130 [Ktedonobacteraceae bacterium]
MELRGKHLVLMNAMLEDALPLLPAFNGDKQFNLWCGYIPEMTLAQVQTDMQETLDLLSGAVWRIVNHTDMLVGVAETALLASHTAWIALLIIRQEFQGRGYGAEAATLLENHLHSYPNIAQVGLAVLVQNAPAQAFWEKRGYVRGKRCIDTQGHDVYEYHLSFRP